MLGYNYDGKTKEFVGTSELHFNPRDKKEYLLPADCTKTPINGAKENFAEVFNDGKWEYKEDHRGDIVYLKSDGSRFTIEKIGKIDSKYTTVVPPVNAQYYKFTTKWVLDNSKKTELIDIITGLIKQHTEQAIQDELWKLPEEEETKFESEYEQFRFSTREDAISNILALNDKTMEQLINLLK